MNTFLFKDTYAMGQEFYRQAEDLAERINENCITNDKQFWEGVIMSSLMFSAGINWSHDSECLRPEVLSVFKLEHIFRNKIPNVKKELLLDAFTLIERTNKNCKFSECKKLFRKAFNSWNTFMNLPMGFLFDTLRDWHSLLNLDLHSPEMFLVVNYAHLVIINYGGDISTTGDIFKYSMLLYGADIMKPIEYVQTFIPYLYENEVTDSGIQAPWYSEFCKRFYIKQSMNTVCG